MPADYTDDNLDDLLWRTPVDETATTDSAQDAELWAMLSAYVDGESTPAETAEVERMLHSDAEYAHAYEFMRQTSLGARSFVEIEPPAHLRDAIYAATSHRPTFTKRALDGWNRFRLSVGMPRIYIAASGTFAVAALVVIALSGRHTAPVSISRIALGEPSRTTGAVTNGNPSPRSDGQVIASTLNTHIGLDPNNLFKSDALPNLGLSPGKEAPSSVHNVVKSPTGDKSAVFSLVKAPRPQPVAVRTNTVGATQQHPVIIKEKAPSHDYSPNPKMDSNSVHIQQVAMLTTGDKARGHDDLSGTPLDTNTLPSKSAAAQDTFVSEQPRNTMLIARLDQHRIPPESRRSSSDVLREASQRSQDSAHSALLRPDNSDNPKASIAFNIAKF